jgi:hypothetical protein
MCLQVGFSTSLALVQRSGAPVDSFMSILRASALYAPTFDKVHKRRFVGPRDVLRSAYCVMYLWPCVCVCVGGWVVCLRVCVSACLAWATSGAVLRDATTHSREGSPATRQRRRRAQHPASRASFHVSYFIHTQSIHTQSTTPCTLLSRPCRSSIRC